jgi:hypothetical protein
MKPSTLKTGLKKEKELVAMRRYHAFFDTRRDL